MAHPVRQKDANGGKNSQESWRIGRPISGNEVPWDVRGIRNFLGIPGNSGFPPAPPFEECVVPQGGWAPQRSQIGALDPAYAGVCARTPGWRPPENVGFRGGDPDGEALPPAPTRPHPPNGVRGGARGAREGYAGRGGALRARKNLINLIRKDWSRARPTERPSPGRFPPPPGPLARHKGLLPDTKILAHQKSEPVRGRIRGQAQRNPISIGGGGGGGLAPNRKCRISGWWQRHEGPVRIRAGPVKGVQVVLGAGGVPRALSQRC